MCDYKNIFKYVVNYFKYGEKNSDINVNYTNNITGKKEVYRIEISQNGKFAATFDTANLRIKILQKNNKNEFETIAHFKIKDDFTIEKFYKTDSQDNDYTETTANNDDQFRWSFDISNMHKNDDKYIVLVAISHTKVDEDMKETKKEKDDKKSDYIRGYLRKIKYKPIDELPSENKNTTINMPLNESNKGTAIYRIELKKTDGNVEEENYILSAVTCYYSSNISGICNFVEVLNKDNSNDSELKRFMILNFHGIYNFDFNDHFDFFNLNEKFEYPQNIRHELDNWYTFKLYSDRMRRFLSCICDKYFLIARYKNGAQSLEVYDLEKMEHKTDAKLIENTVDRYNNYIFSVSMLQFCFAQINIIKLFYIENGLQIASKKFNEIERIHLLEFIDSDEKLFIIGEDPKKKIKVIIWDLYDTGEYELIELMELDDFSINIEDIYTHLAITSGNILHVDDKGKVSSVLEKVENKINKIKDKEDKKYNDKLATHPTDYTDDEKLIFKNLVDRETCVFSCCGNKYKCLYYNKKGTEEEILGLIVGRYTVQIWHQIRDNSKNKDDLPNNGEPFLEYIWSNRIPVNQEREITKLRKEIFKCEKNDGPLEKPNFCLKIYWFERNDSSKPEEHTKMTEHELIKEEDDEINRIKKELKELGRIKDLNEEEKKKRKQEIINKCVKVKIREKVIQRKDIIKKSQAVRHACKALEHLKKLHKSKNITDNYIYEEMVNYIEHIIWRFAKYEPENFRLLDVRYNLMKRLILCNCDRLIKFILFGDEETAKNKIDYRHVPSNKSWPGKKFLKDDDLDFDKRKDGLKENKRIKLENNMELAIYHFRGRELKDAIIVAYLLEYYSRNPTNCVDWMCTVSKAIPLLFEYNYDVFAKKLFVRCFADQCDFSSQDPDEINPKEYLESHNNNTEFRAFRSMVKLLKSDKCDKYKCYNDWIRAKLKSFKTKILKNYGSFEKSPLALRILYLRLKSDIGIYIYYVIIIFEAIIPFLWFMFILLRDPKNMKIKGTTYSGNATNSLTNETLNIKLKPDFDPASSDNPFSSFITAAEAAYFWINGNWVQKDKFDFWAVDLLTLVASIFLVIILQNILIAFMNGVYLTAGAKGKQRLLRYRASCIVCFEGLYHIRFWNPEPEPKYIHYFSQAKIFGEWYNTRKDYDKNPIYKGFEGMSKFKRCVYKEMDYDKFSILKYCNNKNTKIIEDFKNVSNDFNDSIENLIKRNEGKSSIDEFEEIYEVKNTLEVEVKKFQLKLEKLRNLKI
ncbi:hypothetical protein RhiirA4_448599 [Rhizophagus irregularis]|uniref:Ion transport domain-containing protein n=1 Tax=Rhizophagus irregularis TaxID=588596 RepID=A0A2I1HAY6_9GLOM|nr:hypothetical protein RhiirA4_448599 [Rhizophagus irregularis]